MAQTTAVSANTLGLLVDGKRITEGEPLEVRSPYDGSTVATTFRPSEGHVEMAVRAAVRSFEITRRMQAYERQRVLRALAELGLLLRSCLMPTASCCV